MGDPVTSSSQADGAPGQREPRGRSLTAGRSTARSRGSIWLFGGGVGLLIGTWLLLTGRLVIGLLLVGLAVARLIWMTRRRARRRGALAKRGSGDARTLLRSMAPSQFEVAATVLGVERGVVGEKFRGGMSLAEMAGEAGVSLGALTDAITADLAARLEAGRTQGTLRQETSLEAQGLLGTWVPRMVRIHQHDLQT